MGQYFRAAVEINGTFNVYDSLPNEHVPLKLTEHSWAGNSFVESVCALIYNQPANVAWVGDYANKEPTVLAKYLYQKCYAKKGYALQTTSRVIEETTFSMFEGDLFLVNHSKKIFVNCDSYKKRCERDGWCMHPLPLLTAVGNRQGGGDYYSVNSNDIGTWAWDKISIEDYPPNDFEEVGYLFLDSWMTERR